MLKRMRAAHPFLYCMLAVVLFLAVMRAGTTLFVLVLTLLGPAVYWPFAQEDFLLQSVNELFGVLAGVFLLGRTGRLWVYRQRGRGFLDGLLVGMVPFVMVSLAFSVNLQPGPEAAFKPAWQIAVFFLCMFLISLAEETLFRGRRRRSNRRGRSRCFSCACSSSAWRRRRCSGASSPKRCWSTSAPAAPASGKPA